MSRVLIVDDERSIRLTLGEFLRRAGHVVGLAEDGLGAQALLAAEPWDVVVTDIILPRMTGVELLRWIRETAPDTQVVVMTGEPTVDTAAEAVRIGAFDYLAKPIAREAILRVVANAAQLKAMADERTLLAEENRRYQERLEELVRERTAQLAAVQVVAAEITRELEPRRLLDLIVRRACGLVGASAGSVLLYDPERRLLVPHLRTGCLATLGDATCRMGEGASGRAAESLRGQLVNDYRDYPEANQAVLERTAVTAFLAEPLLYRGTLIGVVGLAREDWKAFRPEDQEVVRLFASQAAIAIENARLFQESRRELEERRRTEATLAERTRQLEALRATTQEITQELTLGTVLRLVLRYALELTAGQIGTVYLWDEASQLLVPGAWEGYEEWMGELRLTLDEGVAGTVARCRAGLIVNDFQNSSYAMPRLKTWMCHTAVLAAPLLYRDRLLGVIAVNNGTTAKVFDAEDLTLLQLFAGQAAIAIENAHLYRMLQEQHGQLRQLRQRLSEAEEGERRRLAAELHDQVGQILTALGLNLSVLESLVQPAPASPIAGRLQDSLRLVEETVGHIRNVMAELRPPVLDDYGLLAALKWYAGQFAARTGVAVTVEGAEGEARQSRPVETALFRITQEALNNVLKHARATRATVSLTVEGATARLSVEDDGRGFDPGDLRHPTGESHWGLLSMRERAEAVGGRFRIESTPGRGTRVEVEIGGG